MKDNQVITYRAFVYGIDADGDERVAPAPRTDSRRLCNQYDFATVTEAQAAIVEMVTNFRKNPKHYSFVKVIGSSVVRVTEDVFVTRCPTPITPDENADNRPFPIAAFSI